MKTLIVLTLLLLAIGCQRQQQKSTGSCSVEEKEDQTVVVSCEDGTSAVLLHGADGESCQTRQDPDELPQVALQIKCPGDNDWHRIFHGKDGQSCQVRESPQGATLDCGLQTVDIHHGLTCERVASEGEDSLLLCDNLVLRTGKCEPQGENLAGETIYQCVMK